MKWHDNVCLKRDMLKYVREGYQRRELLSFLQRDYPCYKWSHRSLDRRLRYFDIYFIDQNVSEARLREVVKEELNGPGQLLGYRAMHKKIRQHHNLFVPRDDVYAMMYDIDPTGLENRAVARKIKKKKGNFTTKGPNWVHSLDGHDKLMGYQNSTFPLAVYGCLDTASRKLLWLRVWISNSDPKLVGLWYLEYLMESKISPCMIRLDKGTETGITATMHAFLQRNQGDLRDPVDTVLYGPSTSNQIERWWKELHERLEKYFKYQLVLLKDHGHYDPHSPTDRNLLAYLMIPVMQRELDIFKNTIWNTHRIRAQKNTVLPDGIPNHIYSFPLEYGLEECGIPVMEEDLEKVAHLSGVLDCDQDFLDSEFRETCQQITPHPEEIEPSNCSDAFIHLKKEFMTVSQY